MGIVLMINFIISNLKCFLVEVSFGLWEVLVMYDDGVLCLDMICEMRVVGKYLGIMYILNVDFVVVVLDFV